MNAAARLLNQGVLSRSWVFSILISRSQLSGLILMLTLLFSALSVIYVTNMTRGLNAAFQKMLIERRQIELQWGQLISEKSTWTMPLKVEEVAAQQFDMVMPDHDSTVTVSE